MACRNKCESRNAWGPYKVMMLRCQLTSSLCATVGPGEKHSEVAREQAPSMQEATEKIEEKEELTHDPQVPPLKLGILVFMFLCETPFKPLVLYHPAQ